MSAERMKTCIRCSSSEFLRSGDCKECNRSRCAARYAKNKESHNEKNKAWKLANPEKVIAGNIAYSLKNKDSINEKSRVWRSKNQDLSRAFVNNWKELNPQKLRVYNQNRRSKKTAFGGKLSEGLTRKLFVLQKGKCACCGKVLGDDFHLDHVIPLVLGGSNSDENIQLLTSRCNLQKNRKHPVEFMQSRGFLL